MIKSLKFHQNFSIINQKDYLLFFLTSLGLSWVYALCSQIIIPLPFNLVPISLQPLPLLLCSILLGNVAISAYLMYLIQGCCGLPVFSNFQGGLARLLGPTGGYLIGFLLAMIFLNIAKNKIENSFLLILTALTSTCIYFFCGICQLSFFVLPEKLLISGLYPFLLGDIVKTIVVVKSLFWFKNNHKKRKNQ